MRRRARKPMLFLLLQRQALHHRLVAELAAHAVHGAFGVGAAFGTAVDQVGRVRGFGIVEPADADTQQAIARAVDLAGEQFAAGREDLVGQLRRALQRARPPWCRR